MSSEAATDWRLRQASNMLFVCILSVWLILSVIGNILVLLVILPNRNKYIVVHLYMCNLALSDIFMAAFVLPQNIHDITHPKNFYEGRSY